jgi:signal transduction histidine kinase/ligand-binding sensor domain-containing protein
MSIALRCALVVTCVYQVAHYANKSAHGQSVRGNHAPYLRTVWTTEQGLPQNTVTAILQTRDGYLWLGTLGGLVRFDGLKFTIFPAGSTEGLRSNRIRALYEDEAEDLWIGAEGGGLTRYRHGTFTNYALQDGLPGRNAVTSIADGGAGALWLGTNSGLARFQNDRLAVYATNNALLHQEITAVCTDRAGGVWVGADQGLFHVRAEGVTVYEARDGLPSDAVTALCEDATGSLWVGTTRGVARVKDGRVGAAEGLPKVSVTAFFADRQGSLWIASLAGLLRWRDGATAVFTEQDGLSESNVRSIFGDREANLWIGTDTGGLNRWRAGNLTAYGTEQGLPAAAAPICEDSAGNLWVGAGELYKLGAGQFSAHRLAGRAFAGVWSLWGDRAGGLWIGDARHGLTYLQDDQLTRYPLTPGLTGNNVFAIYQSRDGTVWIGENGLHRFKDGQFTVYRTDDGLPHNLISFITEDRQGALWLGTPAGLSRFAEGQFTNYGREFGLSFVRAIHEDSAGVLWIGTYGFGLSRYQDGRFTRITSKDGLFDDAVSRILADERGNLWMSGNRGIYRASLQELNDFAAGKLKAINCLSYGVADGMITSETNGGGQPHGWKTRDGKLWFPTIKGVVAIDPQQINEQPPPVVIEQIALDGQRRFVGELLRVLPGQDNLEINYTGLSFARTEQMRFKYQLIGLHNDWVDAGARRTAYFTRLAPGEYTFKVIAANGDGVWNYKGAALRLVIIPPFWQTWWFQAFILMSVIGLGYLVYRWRIARLERAHAAQAAFSRQLIESQERERKRIAAELHDGLGQNLLVIKNRALLGLHLRAEHDRAIEQLDEISAASTDAIEEVRQIARNLHPYQLERLGLTKAVRAMINSVASAAPIHFHSEIEPIDGLLDAAAEINLYRIIQESLNNIVKHSGATEAQVTIKQTAASLQITIRDNGRGFTPAAIARQTRGLGLTGIAERTRMLGGTQTIHSVPGEGTTVTIKLDLSDRMKGQVRDQ